MNKRIPTVLFLAFVIVLLAAGCQHEADESTVTLGHSIAGHEAEEKIYSSATLRDNFCDNSIIVVMNNNASSFRSVSNQLSGNLFSNIGVKSIEDLTALPEHLLSADGNICTRNASELAEHFTRVSFNQILHVKLEKNCKQNVLDTISQVEKNSNVLYVGPNFIHTGASANPNDPRLSEQWGLVGTNGIRAREAWAITAGSRNVRVGVIDTGIANHYDLNPAGNSNVTAGWDFFNNNPITNDDIGGHGTNTAGIIGAVGNNDRGISGVAQRVTLVPLQTAFDTSGNGWHYTSTRISAIIYARDLWNTNSRISILNHSIGGFGTNFELLAAVRQFPGLFVWSAGNNGTNTDNFPNIRQFNAPNLISVGAIVQNGTRWSGSNYGANSVNIFAPTNTLTTHINNSYRVYGGTSCAAPHVAGVAALMLSVNPNLTASQIKQIIEETADRDPALQSTSGGRINAYRAVRAAVPAVPITIRDIEGVTAPARDGIPVTSITPTSQFTGTVWWWPDHPVFLPLVEYRAIITLTPRPGYTLQGVPTDFFEVSGAVSTTNIGNSIVAGFPVFGIYGRFGGGTGTEHDPYLIRSIYHLRDIASANDRHFRLESTLMIGGPWDWQPIPEFHGHLDGNGHMILGLNIRSAVNAGLFSVNHGTIENLSIAGRIGPGFTNGGLFAGTNRGIIRNSNSYGFWEATIVLTSTGLVGGTAGGIVGYNAEGGIIISSVNRDNIGERMQLATDHIIVSPATAGGIAGRNSGRIMHSANYGTIHSRNTAGGIVGLNSGMVMYSSNSGTIYSLNIAGGIVGRNTGRLFACCCEADVWKIIRGGGNSNAGGIIYQSANHGAINHASSDSAGAGSVSGRVGGVVGSFEGGVVYGTQSWGLIRYTGPASDSRVLQPSMANIVGYFQSTNQGRGHLDGSWWGWLHGNVRPGNLRWIPHPVNHDQARFVRDHEVGGTTRSRQVLFSASEMMRGVDIDEWLSEYFSRIGTRLIWHEGEDQPRFPARSNERSETRLQPDIR